MDATDMFATRDLALYAAIVATIGGLWSLYTSIVLDRARLRVSAVEGEAVAGPGQRTEVMMIRVSNRGRRATTIQAVSRVVSLRRVKGGHELSADIARELATPKRLGESEGHTFLHGANGGYVSGTIPTRRWYVVDGAGRVHPLRERWRQRFERIVFAPWRWRARRAKS